MYHQISYMLIGVLLILCASIQCDTNEIDLNKIDINKLRDKLPAGLNIPDFNTSSIPKVADDAKRLFKEKCKKVSGDDKAYEHIESAIEELRECATGLIDFEQLQNEIEAAQPTGELDTVFNKYCRKRDIAMECMENFTQVVEPCLDSNEIDGQKSIIKVVKNLLNFVCYKDGDQIALFIAEKGPQCLSERKDELITCMNNTFYNYLPSEKEIDSNQLALPKLVIGTEQCGDMTKLKECVVDSLEKCEESTPANLVEAMFKFVRKETPCVNITEPDTRHGAKFNTAYNHSISLSLLSLSFVMIFSRIFAIST